MKEWIADVMGHLGYVGIALLMFLENLFPPIPSELIMPLAGFTAHQGESGLNFQYVVLAGVAGTMLGALPWYYAGRWLGETWLRRQIDRYGRWIGLSGEEFDRAQRWFFRHGNKAVLLGRLVPGIRTLISLPAGISEMRLAPFLVYSTIGSMLWVTFLTGAGYLLGQNYERVDESLGPVSKIVLAGLLVAAGIGIWRHTRMIRRQAHLSVSTPPRSPQSTDKE